MDLLKNITVDPDLISDHKPIFFNVNMSVKQNVYKVIGFRRHNQNFPESLINTLSSCMDLDNIGCDHSNSSCISCYVDYFRQVTSKIFDECCPYSVRNIWWNTFFRKLTYVISAPQSGNYSISVTCIRTLCSICVNMYVFRSICAMKCVKISHLIPN